MSQRRHAGGVALVALVLLAAATVINGWLPGDDDNPDEKSFVRTGELGDAVALRQVTVTVDDVLGTTGIDEFGSTLATPGVWVVIRFSVTAADENTTVNFAELRDARGRSWGLQGRNESTCPLGPPGVRVGCVAVFEVPVDAIATLRIRLAPQLDQRYDEVADIDLGLTGQDAEDFAVAAPVEVPDTTLGGP